jgi:RNA polymerase sigma factor (sigma-70 family)
MSSASQESRGPGAVRTRGQAWTSPFLLLRPGLGRILDESLSNAAPFDGTSPGGDRNRCPSLEEDVLELVLDGTTAVTGQISEPDASETNRTLPFPGEAAARCLGRRVMDFLDRGATETRKVIRIKCWQAKDQKDRSSSANAERAIVRKPQQGTSRGVPIVIEQQQDLVYTRGRSMSEARGGLELSDLIRRCNGGDEAAWEEFDRLYRPKIRKVAAAYLCRYPQHVDDAVQEVFGALPEILKTFDTARPLDPYIFGITRNKAINLIRKLGPDTDDSPEHGSAEPRGVETLIEEEQRGLVRLAREMLPEKTRRLLELWIEDELSYEEMSELLGDPPVTLRSSVCRAIKKVGQIVHGLCKIPAKVRRLAWEMLPEKTRKLLELRCYEGLSYQEMSERLGEEPEMLRSLVEEGVKELRRRHDELCRPRRAEND